MKDLLRCLQAVQGQVPCTDAARRMMRGELASLTTYFGYPLLFLTLNPADVLHPFTWRHALSTPPQPLPNLRLDEHLLETLQQAQLWKLVAQDPTAAVEAFHTHVNAVLQTLLDVPSSSHQLPSDGIASKHGKGIFGPLSAIFGSIEPQQRGSLHIHFLLFCYSFQDPQSLIQRFAASLELLEARLWSWIRSIVVTAFEAIPHMFGIATATLEQIRPLPYSDTNMMLMHPTYQQHVRHSADHWFAALPAQLLPAQPPSEHPFDLHLPANKTFVPWCLDYVHTLHYPIQPASGRMLLYDLRTSILHSGLLHSCQTKTCYKGKLGKRGYCRLGFWHWLQIGPRTWERCHGIELTPRPVLGTIPHTLIPSKPNVITSFSAVSILSSWLLASATTMYQLCYGFQPVIEMHRILLTLSLKGCLPTWQLSCSTSHVTPPKHSHISAPSGLSSKVLPRSSKMRLRPPKAMRT